MPDRWLRTIWMVRMMSISHSWPSRLIWSMIMSMTMKVPVRPMPAEQWTMIGPQDLGSRLSCLAFTSCRKFSTQPGSSGTP